MANVWVAMSGGVDSSVAAVLLLEQGHEVTGVTMQLWPSTDEDGGCCSVSAVRDARRVCDLLGVPHYTLNFRDSFEREVVKPYAAEYAAGRTPSPCIVCNDALKFSELLAKVKTQGADCLATGHYARIAHDPDATPWLTRAVEGAKDQSYFLYRLTPAQLDHVLFPVGELTKPDVRAIAERIDLHVAEKPESQDACFAPSGPGPVLERYARGALQPGEIVDAGGRVLGTHRGIGHYTVGQRKGLGLPGGPWFVTALDAVGNRVIVGLGEAVLATVVTARDIVWRGPSQAHVASQVRYRMDPLASLATLRDDQLEVRFEAPVRGIAPGQAVVCYEDDRVLGGGVIECAS